MVYLVFVFVFTCSDVRVLGGEKPSRESDSAQDVSAEGAETISSLAFTTASNRLIQIKPKDTKESTYHVEMAESIEELPADLRLDLVYKIGHYEWSLVALRFERRAGCAEVDVTEVVYGSAFEFVKEFLQSVDEAGGAESNQTVQREEDSRAKYFDHHDFYRVQRGTISVGVFDDRLLRGLILWRSSISEVDRVHGQDVLGGSVLCSTADGLIVFRLSERRDNGRTILEDSGRLISGDLTSRIRGGPNNYEYVRTHLFWEGFHEYVAENPLAEAVPPEEAVSLLLARLKEPRLTEGYKDFFRRSLYVSVLGELGIAEAIPALLEVARSPGIDKTWDAHLRRDVSQAIAKIEARSQSVTPE